MQLFSKVPVQAPLEGCKRIGLIQFAVFLPNFAEVVTNSLSSSCSCCWGGAGTEPDGGSDWVRLSVIGVGWVLKTALVLEVNKERHEVLAKKLLQLQTTVVVGHLFSC